MVVASQVDTSSGFGFLNDLDPHAIGIVLMASRLIVMLFTCLRHEDAEADAEERAAGVFGDRTAQVLRLLQRCYDLHISAALTP